MDSVLGLYKESWKEEVEIMIKFTKKPVCPKCGNTKDLYTRYRAAVTKTPWFGSCSYVPEHLIVSCPNYVNYGCGHKFDMKCKDRECQC